MMSRVVVLCALAFAVSAACADTLKLKSGTVLTGEILGLEEDKVKIKTEELGELAVPTNAVVNHIIAAVGQTTPGVETIAPVPKPPETWHGSVHLGYQGSRGNTYENSGSVILHLDRRWAKDRFNGDFGYYYSATGSRGQDTQKTTDRWEAEVKHDHFWSPKVYHFEDARFDRDMIQLLEARYRVGLGAGYQWLEKTEFKMTGKWSFNQELGADWIKEQYEGGNPDEKQYGYCSLRYAHKLNWYPKWAEDMELFHNFEILPEVDEWSKLLAKIDVGFTTKLFLNFDLLIKAEYDFNSKPANNRDKGDFRFIAGLGYKW